MLLRKSLTKLLIINLAVLGQMAQGAESPALESTQEPQKEPGAVYFIPPPDWRVANADELMPHVSIMVVGKGLEDYPPSINLATEKYSGTIREYLKLVKGLNEAQGLDWKDLGTIRTKAGTGSLSQVDIKSKWGEERLMHVILKRNGTIYILTAAALKSEFPRFYSQFFDAFRSLNINPTLVEMITNSQKRKKLEAKIKSLEVAFATIKTEQKASQNNVEALFSNEKFQKINWLPFQTWIENEFNDMEPSWQQNILQETQNHLIEASAIK